MTGISCLHVIPCVKHKLILCNGYYNMNTFRKTYFEMVYLLFEADVSPQENIIILPPKLKGSMGRPRKNAQKK